MNSNLNQSEYNLYFTRVISLILAIAVIAGMVSFGFKSRAADYSVTYKTADVCGYVSKTAGITARSGPGTTYSAVKTLAYKTMVQVIGETTVNSQRWYYIAYATEEAKAYAFCQASELGFVSQGNDAAFEQKLTKEGWPESYKVYLRVLHFLHPNWVFELFDPNVTWEKDLAEQTEYRESYVSIKAVSSWKSNRDDNYKWDEDEYLVFEGTMTNASEDIVAYYIDPRNFLNEQQIFQFEKQTYSEFLNDPKIVDKLLSGTFMYQKNVPGGYEVTETYIPETPKPTVTPEATAIPATNIAGSTESPTSASAPASAAAPAPTPTTRVVTKEITYAEAFVKFGQKYNISPLMLAARVRQEQGVNGDNALISGTVKGFEGYYNYFNINASGNTREIIIQNGMKEAKDAGWNSHYKALEGGSAKVGGNYISKGQDTLYLQKFDLDPTYFDQFWHQYMQNLQAPTYECRNMYSTYKSFGLEDAPITFKIPILKNMPAMACAVPTKDGNCNYRLKSLTVDGIALTPTYSSGTFTYTATAYLGNASVNISAVPINSKTKVEGTGKKSLKIGQNEFLIKTTAERGDKGEYKIIINRLDYDPDPTPTPKTTPTPTPKVTATPAVSPTPGPGDANFTTTLKYVYNENVDKDILYGLREGMTVGELKKCFTLTNAVFEITKNGKALDDSDTASTGILVRIKSLKDGKYIGNLFVVLFGDVNEDGAIDEYDFVHIKRDVWEIAPLTELKMVAGAISESNVSKANDVTEYDFVHIKRHVWGIADIKQSR